MSPRIGVKRIVALELAFDAQLDVARRIHASELDRASMCRDWTVRETLEHSLAVTRKFASFALGETDEPRTPHDEVLGDDHLAAVTIVSTSARAAWASVDRSRRCVLPFGSFSVEGAIGINLFDVLAHTWDIAEPLGLVVDVDDSVWITALEAAREVLGESRDLRHYDPPTEVGPEATPMRRALAWLGRPC